MGDANTGPAAPDNPVPQLNMTATGNNSNAPMQIIFNITGGPPTCKGPAPAPKPKP